MKTALITGGAKRLGKAITLKLRELGFRTIAIYNSTNPDFETESIKVDLSMPSDVANAISQFGKPDILMAKRLIEAPDKA